VAELGGEVMGAVTEFKYLLRVLPTVWNNTFELGKLPLERPLLQENLTLACTQTSGAPNLAY
jgi:hypothetical protein